MAPRVHPHTSGLRRLTNGLGLGDSLTVEPRTLTPLVLVRIQVPQPPKFARFVNDLAGFFMPDALPFCVAYACNTDH